jgi:hypothetical protein
MRRCRGLAKLGPGTLQSSWTGEVTAALTEAHAEVQAAKARQDTAWTRAGWPSCVNATTKR